MKSFAVACGVLCCLSGQALADCKSDVDNAFAKLRSGKAFRLETKIVNDQGSLTMAVDYLLPDRMHQRVSLGDSATKMETIAISGKVWSNQGQGWTEVPATFADAITKQLKETVAEPGKSPIDYTCAGEKEFEGKTYQAYTAKLPAIPEERAKNEAAKPKPAAEPNVQTLYIDKDTGLPARNIVARADAPDKWLFNGTFSTPKDMEIKEPVSVLR